jgi:PEP-CTERM motif
VYKRATWILCLLAATAASLSAESLSFTGTLNTSEDVFTTTFTLTTADTLTFQTWGFGGGTNAAGHAIAAGGFDPLITLFSGPVATATLLLDGFGDQVADADNLSDPPWSFVGNCPAAGTVTIGSTTGNCGDDFMQATLSAGTYTLLLTDANYIPGAFTDGGTLSEPFVDLTGGVFQTCVSPTECITPNGNYAVDILSTQPLILPTAIPEPSTLPLLCIGLAVLAGAKRSSHRRISSHL